MPPATFLRRIGLPRASLRCGWPRHDIKQGISLILECPWSIRCAEQLHASLSLIKRYHPDGGQESLVVRAGIHSMRLLLPELSELQRKEARCCDRLSRLSRQQYFKVLVDLCVAKRRAQGLTGAGGQDEKNHEESWYSLW